MPSDITVDHRESVASVPTNHTKKETNYPFLTNIDLHPSEVTENEIVYKVGNFPIKKVDVNVLKQHEIVPGGQSIGVQLHKSGVLVVGHHMASNVEMENTTAEDAHTQLVN